MIVHRVEDMKASAENVSRGLINKEPLELVQVLAIFPPDVRVNMIVLAYLACY